MDQKAIEHELNFWKGFVQTERFLKGWLGEFPTPELRSMVAEFLQHNHGQKVLDVGSGVVSILHGTVPAENLLAVDPLGEHYALIFDYPAHGLKHPLPSRAEDIPFDNECDIVHISNALDHSQDPVAAFNALYRAVKPGGFLIVQGFENEGRHENWQGFHQWNLSVENDSLMLENINGEEVVLSHIHDKYEIFTIENNRTWFVWIQQKPVE